MEGGQFHFYASPCVPGDVYGRVDECPVRTQHLVQEVHGGAAVSVDASEAVVADRDVHEVEDRVIEDVDAVMRVCSDQTRRSGESQAAVPVDDDPSGRIRRVLDDDAVKDDARSVQREVVGDSTEVEDQRPERDVARVDDIEAPRDRRRIPLNSQAIETGDIYDLGAAGVRDRDAVGTAAIRE